MIRLKWCTKVEEEPRPKQTQDVPPDTMQGEEPLFVRTSLRAGACPICHALQNAAQESLRAKG